MRRFSLVLALATALALSAMGSAWAFLGLGGGHEKLTPKDGQVVVDAAGLKDGQARFYQVQTPAGLVKFFLVQGPDRKVRAAFDACEVCWREGKGYSQKGAAMICTNCGQSFPVQRVGDVHGGCNPSPLAVAASGGQARIQIVDLAAGARLFLR